MKIVNIFLILIIFSLQLLANFNYPHNISLNGDWLYKIDNKFHSVNYIYKFSGSEPSMKIPNNWYLNGINHSGVIWFNKKFKISKSYKNRNIFLSFDGVDYISDVWVNGNYIGNHEGYFQNFKFNITKYLNFNKQNFITIRVNSPFEAIGEYYSLRKTTLRGIFAHHDTRAGNAWSELSQDRNSGGIWNDIKLLIYDDIKIDNLFITSKIKSKKLAKIRVDFELENFKKIKDKKASITIEPRNFKSKGFMFEVDLKESAKQSIEFNLNNPKLWETWDYGFPHLYNLTLKINDTKIKTHFGIREVRVDKKDIFYLNKNRVFLRGTNYISSHYLSEMSEEKFKKDLKLMKEANINAIRVHAHIEPKIFYKLADEMGFLVWQDYNLQWGYTEDIEFKKEAKKQIVDMVEYLYNHPSIILWSIHNEPPWDSPWMKWKYFDYKKSDKQNYKLDLALFDVVKKRDTTRHIKMISDGKEHPWYGWYSLDYFAFDDKLKSSVISEYGAQALPNINSLQKIIPTDKLFPKSKKDFKIWNYFNFQERENFEIAKIKKGANIFEFIENSQTYQADLIKYATESMRVQKYKNISAIFQFLFNEPFTSINWGIIDNFRVPKKGYFSLKNSFEPILPIAKLKDNKIDIYVVNDYLREFKDVKLSYSLYDKNSKLIKFKEININIKKDSVKKIESLRVKKDKEYNFFINIEVDGKVVTNSYSFKRKSEEK